MTFLTFPKGFFWGTASSGPQTEGRFDGDGKGENCVQLLSLVAHLLCNTDNYRKLYQVQYG